MKKSVFSFIIPLAILSLAVFVMPASVGAQVAQPDLAVIDVQFSPNPIYIGDWITTTIRIRNVGDADMMTPFIVNVQGTIKSVDSLSAKAEVEVTIPNAFSFTTPGHSTLNFGIDASDSNQSNNWVAKTLTILQDPTKPSVMVISPNEGEKLIVGQTYLIKVNTTILPLGTETQLQLRYEASGDCKGGCEVFVDDIATISGNQYSWVIPAKYVSAGINPNRFQIHAKLVGPGVSNPAPEDYSDSHFTIASSTSTPCYTFSTNLQLGSRGADVVALQTFLIAKGFPIADLSASGAAQKGYFGYATYLALRKYQASVGIPATGYFGPLTRQKVNADCSTTPPVPIKSIVVNSPNGGEVWQQGSKHDITWSSKDSVGKIVNIYADFANPSNILCIKSPCISSSVLIAEKVTNKGVYTWNVGNADYKGGLPNDNYYVRVCSVTDKNNCDSSDAPFSLVSPTSPSPLTVTYPKVGQVLQTGSKYKIMWTTGSLDKDALFDITVFLDSGKGNIFEGLTAAQASCVGDFNIKGGPLYTCIVGWTPTEVSSKAQLAVVKRGTNEVGYSGSFSIVSTTNAQPSITVQSPNGGENYSPTEKISFSANANYIPKQVVAYLYSSTNGNVASLNPSVDQNRKITGIFQGDPSIGIGQYKVTVCDELTDNPKAPGKPLCDSSDSYFNVTKIPTIPAPTATFTIEGQESYTYVPGQTNHYKWSSTNADRFSSSYTSTGPSVCGGGAWIANTAAGESNTYLDTRYVGCTWNVTYTATNSKTGKSASDTVVVKVIQSPDSASDIRATFVSSSVDVASGPSANDDVGTFQIKYNVEAVNGDVYIASTTPLAVDYVVERSGVKVTSGAIATSLMNNTDSSLTATGNYRIDEGVRNTFTFFVSVPLGGALTSGMYRMSITGLKWNTVDDVSPDKVYTDLPGFSTSYNGLNYSGGDSFAGTIQTPSMITSAIWDAVKEYMNAR